jgi:putative addiction module CopG family antidote
MAIDLPHDLEERARAHVAPGEYPNVAEVVRATLDALDREEQREAVKLARLRAAIDEGDQSGIFEGDPFAAVREKYGL